MGHIKTSQIRIHLIKNVEKYIGICITHFLSHIFRKPNLNSIIKLPHNRHGEGGWIPWLLIGDGEHVPFHFQNILHCFSIHVIHLVYFFLNFLNHHHQLLFEDELLVEEYLLTWIHLSILTYPKFGKATIKEVSPFLHKISSTKVIFDSITAFKESQTFFGQLSLEIEEFSYPFSFFSKTHTRHIPHVFHHCNHLIKYNMGPNPKFTFHPSIHNQAC